LPQHRTNTSSLLYHPIIELDEVFAEHNQLRQGRILGLVVTVAGFLSVAFFLWGLR
jgi:hypothetical protein